MKEIHIDEKNYGQRIDKYLLRYFPQMPKSFLYKMFRKKNISLNKKKIEGNEILQKEDVISVFFSEETFCGFRQSNRVASRISFTILYEDEDIIAVNKPANLLSQPDGTEPSLVDELSMYLPDMRIGIVSRLDRNTTGVVIAGKNVQALQHLNQIRIIKKYHAVIYGKLEKKLILQGYLEKESASNKVKIDSGSKDFKGNAIRTGGKEIVTEIKPLRHNESYSLVEVIITKGKPHQIRAHLASIERPIVGDFKYGNKEINSKLKRKFGLSHQLLHCYEVEVDGRKIKAPYPEMFARVYQELLEKE